jgi:hypothetical protein
MMKDRPAKNRTRYRNLKGSLAERARRLYVANEEIALGYGGIVAAPRAMDMAPSPLCQ